MTIFVFPKILVATVQIPLTQRPHVAHEPDMHHCYRLKVKGDFVAELLL